MGRKRGKRREAVRQGYKEKKREVRVGSENKGVEKVVKERVERGYRKGYSIESVGGNGEGGLGKVRRVKRRYTKEGSGYVPGRRERKVRSKRNRPVRVSRKELWGRGGEGGTYRRQTTGGRKSKEAARQGEVGGRRRRWVR